MGSAPPSPAQLEYCLDLIRQRPAAGPEEANEPFRGQLVWYPDFQGICIEFVNREALPIGAIYRSWFLTWPPEGPPHVMYARSRKGAEGDSTLPPE